MLKEKIQCIVATGEEQKIIAKVLKEFPKISAQTYSSVKQLIDYIAKHKCDLLIVSAALMDNSLETFQQMGGMPETILLSPDYNLAADGYEYNLSGFVSLPVDEVKLYKAVQKAEQTILQKKKEQIYGNGHHPFLFIRAEYKLMKITFDDILYIEGLKDYSKIYTKLATNKAIITLQNLKSFEEKLSSEDFIRVHRSYIVSLSKIDIIHKNSILIGKTEIPVSDGFRNHLHSVISKYL